MVTVVKCKSVANKGYNLVDSKRADITNLSAFAHIFLLFLVKESTIKDSLSGFKRNVGTKESGYYYCYLLSVHFNI